MSKKTRLEVFDFIKENSISWSVGIATPKEIDDQSKNFQHMRTIPIESPKTTKIAAKLSNLNLLGLEKYQGKNQQLSLSPISGRSS
jgi:ribonuclease HII